MVELIEEDLLNSIENKEEIQTLMDFPMGYIKYSSSSRDWYHSQLEFTITINKLIKKVLSKFSYLYFSLISTFTLLEFIYFTA